MNMNIFSAIGNLFRSEPAYRGAGNGFFKNWRPKKRSADADYLPEKDILNTRQADLIRNNGVVRGIRQTQTDNIVGAFLMPIPQPNYVMLGKDAKWAREWSKKTRAAFKLWANSLDCSLARNQNFHGMTQLTFKQCFDGGDSFAVPRWKKNRDNAFCLQIIDSDRVCNPYGKADDEFLRAGIVKNADGEAIGYKVASRHPTDLNMKTLTWTHVPARTPWGRRMMIHTYNIERPEQSRGIGALVSVLSEFKLLDDYTQAELKATVNNALIAAFVKSDMPDELLMQIYQPDADSDADATTASEYMDAREGMDYSMKPNGVIPLLPNEDVTPFLPGRPNQAYAAFVENIFRQIGVAFNVSYELLMKDFSKTNYSSARASLLECYRFFKSQRAWLIATFCQPVYELWLEEQVNKGAIEAPDFYANKAAYCQSTWISSGRGWVDPVKEANAAKLRMQYGLSSLTLECAEQGLDIDEHLDQLEAEREMLAARGIKLADLFPDPEPEEPDNDPEESEDDEKAATQNAA